MKHEHPSFRLLIPRFLSQGVLGWTCGFMTLCAGLGSAAEQEPSYNGRLLSEWLGDMRLGQLYSGPSPTQTAVQAMGTNAIPTLLKWMSYEP
ncbi:MAG TPA: hypothetical protein VIN67_02500, partial [Desulfobaccales bacterium]